MKTVSNQYIMKDFHTYITFHILHNSLYNMKFLAAVAKLVQYSYWK